jgi:O-antigen/teichoic acid export membrane protein
VSAGEEHSTFLAGLFGRGLLYVAVTSLPIVTATIVSPVLAHLLGPVQFGLFAAAISLHQVLMALAMFGLDQALILARAEARSDRAARVLITVGTLVALALNVLFAATVPLWSASLGFGSARSLAVATACWTAPTAFLQLGLALLMAQDRLRSFAVVSMIMSLGRQVVGLVFLFVWDRTSAVYAWGNIAGLAVAVVACVLLVRPLWSWRDHGAVVRRAFGLGLPITLATLSNFVLNSADRLVIQHLLGPAEVGRYQVAYTIGFEAFTVFAFTGSAWAARFAEVRDDALRWRLLGQARDHLYELLAPALLGVNLIAPLALRIFAPESFHPAGLLLVVLLVTLSGFPTVAMLGSTRALIIQRRTAPIAVAAGVAAVVNLALNFLLVPVLHLEGAAVATAIAFSLEAVIQRAAFRPFRAWPRSSPRLLALVLAAAAVATAFAFGPQSPHWIAIRTVLAGLAGVWLIMAFLRRRAEHLRVEPGAAGGAPGGPGTTSPQPAISDTRAPEVS